MTAINDGVEPRSLTICCVIHSLNGGVAERVMAGLVTGLAERGHDVTLVTYDDAKNDRHRVGAEVIRRPLSLSTQSTGVVARLNQIRKRVTAIKTQVTDQRADVVLSFCDRNNIDVLLAMSGTGIPVVVCERSDPRQQSMGWFWNRVRRHIYRRAASVVALTETSGDYLRRFSSRVTVIPSAVKAPSIVSNRDAAIGARAIVGAGRLESEKGFDRLVTAFARATADDDSWRLIIYGDGSLRKQLIDQAVALGIRDRFELPGWTKPLDQPLSQATFFCLSSRYEGFPSVLLESMSMGVPSVSVDCESGPRAIVEHGRNGLLVDPTTEGLTEGIVRLIQNPGDREKLGRAGMEVAELFSWPKMIDRYEKLLHGVCKHDAQAS